MTRRALTRFAITTAFIGWLPAAAACGGHGTVGTSAAEPGRVDKEQATAAAIHARAIASLVVAGDHDKFLNELIWLRASAAEIVIGDAPAANVDAQPYTPPAPPSGPGTASCDGTACVFTAYVHVDPGSYHSLVDGTVSILRDATNPSDGTVAIQLTTTGLEEVGGPASVAASWTFTPDSIDGSYRRTFTVPSLDDDLVRFDHVTFSADKPDGGTVYAKWITAEFGTVEGAASLP